MSEGQPRSEPTMGSMGEKARSMGREAMKVGAVAAGLTGAIEDLAKAAPLEPAITVEYRHDTSYEANAGWVDRAAVEVAELDEMLANDNVEFTRVNSQVNDALNAVTQFHLEGSYTVGDVAKMLATVDELDGALHTVDKKFGINYVGGVEGKATRDKLHQVHEELEDLKKQL